MATYTVSYRGKNGERIEEQFEAPDRNSLFKILADRKISAISVKDGAAPKRKKSSAPSKPLPPSVLRGAFAGVALVALAVVIWSLLSKREETPQEEPTTKKGLIKEVTPAKVVREKVIEESPKPKTYDELRRERNEAKLKEARDKARAQGLPWADSPRKYSQLPEEKKIFDYDCEGHIAALLQVQPGTPIIGDFDFGDAFIEDFKQAVAMKIKINDDDDEYTRTLKQQVQETKDDLKRRFLEGEDIGAVFRDTRKELQQLGLARMEIDTAMHEVMEDPNATAEDLEDFEAAANKILTGKGLEPLKMPKYWSNRIKLLKAQRMEY